MTLAHKDFELHDIVQMKKPPPCGENRWPIIRMGADIRIKCHACGHSVMMPRRRFTKKRKKILANNDEHQWLVLKNRLLLSFEMKNLTYCTPNGKNGGITSLRFCFFLSCQIIAEYL